MEKVKGMDIRFEGFKDTEGFALSILYLTNLKSSIPESVVEVNTFMDSNEIQITCYKDFYESHKDVLERKVGKVSHMTELTMYGIEYDDIDSKIIEDANKQMDKYLDDETDTEPEPFLHLIK